MSDNSPSSGVETVEKGIKSITSLTKGLTEFLRWVAGMIRNRDWVGLLMFAIAVFLVFWGTKLTLGTMVKEPIFYGIWVMLGVMFFVGLIIELRTKPPIKHIYREAEKRKAIKFLSSFEEEDAEIYARLQGYRDLRVIIENVVHPEFSFGVLKGKSGSGKSSYLKAGLLATLNKTETYRGVYVKFSDSDSLETVKDAFVDSLSLDNAEVESLNFIQLLKKGIETASQSCEDFKCLILVFDQFEQFFVYTDDKIRRDSFIQELVTWYNDNELTEEVKILVSIREDWFARLDEIQEALNYSLRIGSQSGGNSFYIKNFSPEEATMILAVMAEEDLAIAENDKQGFERDYVQEVLEKELASVSDGLISPVDLQIIAETIKQQNTSAMRAFNHTVFQKLGGIEGLRRSFLESMLEPLGSERKKSAIQVLVALTNLEQQTRSQVQTLEQLQEKVKAHIAAKEVEKIVTYLQETGLITVAEKEGIKGFELSHEGMISAVIRLGEKIQDQAYRANQLLERRVNEWLGNRRSSRYYFNLKELWLLEQQQPYLRWGKKREQKQVLLQKSKQKIYAVLGFVGSLIFIVIGVWSWLNYTTTGIITQVRWKLSNISEKISGSWYQAQAVTAFAKDGNFERALKLSEKINDSRYKAYALMAMAETYDQLQQADKALTLLDKALSTTDNIDHSSDKADALKAISETIGQLKQPDKALTLLEKALSTTDNIDHSSDKADALRALAETIGKLKQPDTALTLLEKALSTTDNMDDSDDKADALRALAETYDQLKQADTALTLLDKALSTTDNINHSRYKADALKALAETIGQLNQPDKALTLLDKALSATDNIDHSFHKASALRALAETYEQLKQPDKALTLLDKALSTTDNIDHSYEKASALTAIAETYEQLKQPDKALTLLDKALSTTDNIDHSRYKTSALRALAETIGQLKQPDTALTLLDKALSTTDKINDSRDKASALRALAETIGQLKQPDKALTLLDKALSTTDNIDNSSAKASALRKMAETIDKLKQPDKALTLLEKALSTTNNIDDSDDKAYALRALAETIGKLQQPDKALTLLDKALSTTDNIDDSSAKASALTAMSESAANLKQWKLALKAYQGCPGDDCEVETLATILTIYAEQENPELNEE